MEKIPYSKRTRLVLMPRMVERGLGELIFKIYKMKHKKKLLPATHPTSVRAVLIAKNVITALERGLRDEKVWGDPKYVSRATKYLKHVNWEVVVVDEPIINAYCYPGGKIVLLTGDLRYLSSDAEIAFIIGHEVAHAVARHSGEQITKSILGLLLCNFMPDVFRKMISRKMESEADYIGVMLMASAGYDPRVAVNVWKKMARLSGYGDNSYWTKLMRKVLSYTSTHPSDKERVESLAQAQEEAMKFYKESQSHLRIRQNINENINDKEDSHHLDWSFDMEI